MKKWIALILIVAVIGAAICFAVSSSKGEAAHPQKPTGQVDTQPNAEPSEEVTIIGKWTGSLDLTFAIVKGFENSGIQFQSDAKLIVPVSYVFREDGSYTFAYDVDAYKKNIADYYTDIHDDYIEYVYAIGAAGGASRDEVDEKLAAQGMTMDIYVSRTLDASAYDSMDESSLSKNGYFRFEDGKLYTVENEADLSNSEDYFICELDGTTLRMIDVSESIKNNNEKKAIAEGLIPITLTKELSE